MSFYSMEQLAGNGERNWIHVVNSRMQGPDGKFGVTYCGFSNSEMLQWADPASIHYLGDPFARQADCPDCLRKFKAKRGIA